MLSSANRRALSASGISCFMASSRAAACHDGPKLMFSQNLTASVCSAVRAVLLVPPRLLTSLKSRAHSALDSAGGGPGRNWSALLNTHGFARAYCSQIGGVVGTYTPGAVCGR